MIYQSTQEAEFRILPLLQPSPDLTPVDLEEVKLRCSSGLSASPAEDRAWAWIALLEVFPPIANSWKDELDNIVKNYFEFVNDFGMSDWHNAYARNNAQLNEFKEMGVGNPNLMKEIHGDIVRSYRNIKYLPKMEEDKIKKLVASLNMSNINNISLNEVDSVKNSNSNFLNCNNNINENGTENNSSNSNKANMTKNTNVMPFNDKLIEYNEDIRRMERILYIFSSINVTFSYMQGFNELVIPLYYVNIMGKDVYNQNIDFVEAVTYNSFQRLITATAISELYTVRDQAEVILSKLEEFQKVLDRTLPKVSKFLQNLGIEPIQFAYRWFNLLFSQEHELPPLLVVWDSLLAHQPDLVGFAYYVGIAHIEAIQDDLFAAEEMAVVLSMLQSIKVVKIIKVLERAQEMWLKDKEKTEKKKKKPKKKLFHLRRGKNNA